MRKQILIIMVSSIVGAWGSAANAAIGNAAGDSPLTPSSSASSQHTNTADQLFIQLIGIGGKTEVELGEMAGMKASTDSVQRFGKRMVKDHENANRKLEKIADNRNIKITSQKDPDHERQRKHLSELRGAEFDREYMRTQIAEHQRTALLLNWIIGSGQNADLKEYAAETLVDVMEHLRLSMQIFQDLVAPPSKPMHEQL